ncbi:hypothetical protein [uncultured Metabacillus sp.]|uniref:hypothetical protein n=1 Tax=uncultured Metabacillus sp. TaxID=2860135 RepID=UPI00261C6674|nr:hypothetical protein [uncultured Metabacillus sp.]
MTVKTRKNKGYISILLDEVSEQSFKEAKNTYDSIDGTKVIKPSKKAWESFVKLHSLTLDKVKAGEEYKVLGTKFTVIRNLDHSRTGSNEWYPIVRYFDRSKNEYEEFGIVSTDNFAVGVHETCFKNQTGILLYF